MYITAVSLKSWQKNLADNTSSPAAGVCAKNSLENYFFKTPTLTLTLTQFFVNFNNDNDDNHFHWWNALNYNMNTYEFDQWQLLFTYIFNRICIKSCYLTWKYSIILLLLKCIIELLCLMIRTLVKTMIALKFISRYILYNVIMDMMCFSWTILM